MILPPKIHRVALNPKKREAAKVSRLPMIHLLVAHSELEAHANLNLPAGIREVAVGVCDGSEHVRKGLAVGVQTQARRSQAACYRACRRCDCAGIDEIPQIRLACGIDVIEQ